MGTEDIPQEILRRQLAALLKIHGYGEQEINSLIAEQLEKDRRAAARDVSRNAIKQAKETHRESAPTAGRPLPRETSSSTREVSKEVSPRGNVVESRRAVENSPRGAVTKPTYGAVQNSPPVTKISPRGAPAQQQQQQLQSALRPQYRDTFSEERLDTTPPPVQSARSSRQPVVVSKNNTSLSPTTGSGRSGGSSKQQSGSSPSNKWAPPQHFKSRFDDDADEEVGREEERERKGE